MKIAGLTIALFTIIIGLFGIVATDSAIAFRRGYYGTPGRFYAVAAIRVAMGLVLILAASKSRSPGMLRVLGAIMCMQATVANLFGIERARAIMEWETMQGHAALRLGAAIAMLSGVFVAWAFRVKPAE